MKSCLEEYRDCDVEEIAGKYIEGTPQVDETAAAPGESNSASMIRGREGNTKGNAGRNVRGNFTQLKSVTGRLPSTWNRELWHDAGNFYI